MGNTYSRENGLNEPTGMVLGSSTTKKPTTDEVPDYNEAFPQLISAGQVDVNRANTFFSSAFPSSSSSNGNNSAGALANTTSSLYSATKNDEDRRRQMAIHASSATTKIVSDVARILTRSFTTERKHCSSFRLSNLKKYLPFSFVCTDRNSSR